jgi:hypothetical protein
VGRLRANAVLLLFAAALVLRLLVVFLEPPTRPLGDEPAWLAVADSSKRPASIRSAPTSSSIRRCIRT